MEKQESEILPQGKGKPSEQHHAKGAIRHAEKRRIGTCRFADRVASISLDVFRETVPSSFRDVQKQTCVSCIVAHFSREDHLEVLSLGVGTKFLPERLLNEEQENNDLTFTGIDGLLYHGYGCRLRDCHAEVLARRAFCRRLHDEIHSLRNGCERGRTILESCDSSSKVKLRSGVTLHMYSSSAPCGNATLKKFATITKEKLNATFGADEWPLTDHDIIPPHSIHLGQFSLLLKKDQNVTDVKWQKNYNKKSPANETDDWCPPGTTTTLSNQGSIHTCSDKICRWNYLGLQGSLLASIIETPLYLSSLTVGRKFTSIICRRAVCCRAVKREKKRKNSNALICTANASPIISESFDKRYSLNHPSIMGTGVYMDDTGILEMSGKTEVGQDVRFNSPLCWAWWPDLGEKAECIDGNSGLALQLSGDETESRRIVSRLSTVALLDMMHSKVTGEESLLPLTLKSIKLLKLQISPEHEAAKSRFFTENETFREWRHRFVK